MQVTITLDSGAFFEELIAGRSYSQLEVGYFGSGPSVSDIQVLADGKRLTINEYKLGNGTIEIRQKNSSGTSAGSIEITDALAASLLKKTDLYPSNPPQFDRDKFDCILSFASGRFCCSMVKERRFVEYDLPVYSKTSNITTRHITHNVAVHFDLAEGDELELRRQNADDPIFSTINLPPGTRRVDIDIVADNTTAEKLYYQALDMSGHTKCWLPNQGDPPTLGSP